jgi:hypothetical protein
MSAEIILFVPRPNPKRIESMAIEVMNQCFPSWPGGIDDLVDTAPCEMIPYHAPESDPA